MWIAKKLSHATRDASPSEQGTVTIGGAEAAVLTKGERRNVPVIAPGGYAWRPKRGAQVLVLKGGAANEERYILGDAASAAQELADGEVCVFSSGGAAIYLRNSGRVEIVGDLYINGERYVPSTEELE